MRRSFDIFGLRVPVKFFSDKDNNELLGFCTKNPIEIYINKDYGKEEMNSTLSHELIHAVIFRLGLDQTLSREMQEILAESIGELITTEFTPRKGKKK